ncbi:MAG: dienelactone hydrolase family protein [Gemmatimonadaceae bacterium]|nr:dienelactone hydrolase family protein [Gemmatimonadaceae bacterium]
MPVAPLFDDRHAAGLALAERLSTEMRHPDIIVLGMARGGVMVAAPIARALGAPLDAFVCRKLGVPGIPEVAFGAIAEGGAAPVFDAVCTFIGMPNSVRQSVVARERVEAERRVHRYRDGHPLTDLAGRTVILVDDGIASGATMKAAALALRDQRPARLIAAAPVASIDGVRYLSDSFDDVVVLATPQSFGTVSDWYRDYTPVDDDAVRALLGKPVRPGEAQAAPLEHDAERRIMIPMGHAGAAWTMIGDHGHDGAPTQPTRGLVIFAHGGGSSRASYRNRYLAGRLRMAGWATLRVDLLSDTERQGDTIGAFRFDIDRITSRLLAAVSWCRRERVPGCQRLVLYGASTGAAAAMAIAASHPEWVAGVIARGGRVDLAAHTHAQVRAPALLIVGSTDSETLRQNRECAARLRGRAAVQVVRGAGHTFEESGALGRVGELSVAWLERLHRRAAVRRWISLPAAWFSRAPRVTHRL